MTTEQFINNYNTATDKNKFLSDCITKQYIPYHEKVSDCTGIVKATTEKDGCFVINTPAQFMLFSTLFISKYTDIELDNDNILDTFERLDELDLINKIISNIPDKEYNSYNTILNMVLNDYMENNRNIISYIDTKIKAIGLSADMILDAIQKYTPQDEKNDNNIK